MMAFNLIAISQQEHKQGNDLINLPLTTTQSPTFAMEDKYIYRTGDVS